MANKVQLKAAGDQEFKNNDPFAELTRIMGFDPRVQPTPRPDEDFEIDLEKELMGMFDPGPDAPAGPTYPQESDAASPAGGEMDEAFAAHLEEELADSDDFWETADEAEAAPAIEDEAIQEGAMQEEAAAYSDAVDEALADVDMDFGGTPMQEPGPQWNAEPVAFDEPVEPEATQPTATEDRNVYRPVFSAPGYTNPGMTEARPSMRQYGAVEAPVFNIRSFKSAAQQYREATPKPASAPREEIATVPAEERPAPRARGIDPFDILAALGTERALPQRRDPMKGPMAAPVAEQPLEPVTPHVEEQQAFVEEAPEYQSFATDYPESQEWEPAAAQEFDDASVADEGVHGVTASGSDLGETDPFLNIRAAEPMAPAEEFVVPAVTDIDPTTDAMYASTQTLAEDDTFEGERYAIQEAAEPSYAPTSEIDAIGEAEFEPAGQVDETPDIDTTEVFEPAVAVADDLDIPMPAFEEQAQAAPVYDELDEEFEHAFETLSRHTDAIRQAAQGEEGLQPAPTTNDIERLFAEELGINSRSDMAGQVAAAGATAAFVNVQRAAAADEFVFDDNDFLPDEFTAPADDAASRSDEAAPAYAPRRAGLAHGRGKLLAGVAIGVVLLGGIGAFALSGGASMKGDQPAVIKADAKPMKVKPKNPGGVNVPNQDNKVYERVADGATAVAPEQKKLVSTEEKPVDISAQAKDQANALPGVFEDEQAGTAATDAAAGGNADDNAASGGAAAPAARAAVPSNGSSSQDIANLIKAAPKGEDRLTSSSDAAQKRADNDVLTVTPHKVRTMIVRADGTMVPREDPAESQQASAAPSKNAPAAALPSSAPVPAREPAAKPAASSEDAMATMAKASVGSAETPKPVERVALSRPDRGQINTPVKAPAVPSRPADQPVDIGGAAATKVASAEPAPVSAAASGDWSVQIASQPTAEAAQTSYQNMARRYGGVLSGHAVNIVKADIAGKGTYYRVRIAAGSKDAAIGLCTKLKSAGGSCFVSK